MKAHPPQTQTHKRTIKAHQYHAIPELLATIGFLGAVKVQDALAVVVFASHTERTLGN